MVEPAVLISAIAWSIAVQASAMFCVKLSRAVAIRPNAAMYAASVAGVDCVAGLVVVGCVMLLFKRSCCLLPSFRAFDFVCEND